MLAAFGADAAEIGNGADSEQVLKTVVVTASGFEQYIKDAPASISVITREELESKAFRNLADALADTEGIYVERGGKAGGMNIQLRGMGSEYTLILIDGRRVSQGGEASRPNGFSDVETNFIPPLSAIERIEVVRGPMSTLYGSDAMGGVVNIITRKVGKNWTGSVQFDTTIQDDSRFGNVTGTNIYLNGPLVENKLGLAIRGNYVQRADADTFTYRDANGVERDITGFNGLGKNTQRGLGLRLTYTPDASNDISFDFDRAQQIFDNRNQELGTLNENVAASAAGGGYKKEMRFNRDRYVLAHNGRYGFGNWDSSLLYDTTETVGRTNPMSIPRRPTDGTSREIEYNNVVLDSKLTMPLLNDRHFLTLGGQYWRQTLKDTYVDLTRNNMSQYQWALFVENEWRMRDDLALTVGARYDNNQVFGSQWSPRAYLVWNTDPKWTFKGGVSKGYKTPNLNQMIDGIYNVGGQGTMPLIGNSALVPETSTSSELGFRFDNQDGKTASLTVFHNKFKDKLSSESVFNCLAAPVNRPGCLDLGAWERNGVPVDTFSRRINVDTAVTRGLELNGTLPLAAKWMLHGNYTLTRSEQQSGASKGQPLNDVPRHMANLRLNWKPTDRIDAWVSTEYRAKQFRGVYVGTRKHAYYDNYTLVHLGGSYRTQGNVKLAATLYNLFDKDFIHYASNPTSASTAYANSYDMIREGRRFWLSATVEF
jgi:outer membrane receptor for ferrienterochelin and colicins